MFVRKLKLMQSVAFPNLRLTTKAPSVATGFVRGYAGRKECPEDPNPRCSPEKMENVTCEDPKQSPWYKPECCLDPCPDAMPRFDDLYYKVRKDRKYTRTWIECPDKIYAVKKVCCYDNVVPPQYERRARRSCHGPCIKLTESSAQFMKCRADLKQKCPRTTVKGCKQARFPPRCQKVKVPSTCKKVCTPFPSFSECNKPSPRKRHPSECGCLIVGTLCP